MSPLPSSQLGSCSSGSYHQRFLPILHPQPPSGLWVVGVTGLTELGGEQQGSSLGSEGPGEPWVLPSVKQRWPGLLPAVAASSMAASPLCLLVSVSCALRCPTPSHTVPHRPTRAQVERLHKGQCVNTKASPACSVSAPGRLGPGEACWPIAGSSTARELKSLADR